MEGLIVYRSRYGSSEQYACWLSHEIKWDFVNLKTVQKEQLENTKVVVFIGSIYIGKVIGLTDILKVFDLSKQSLILCMVGMTPIAYQKEYAEFFRNNVPERDHENIPYFILQLNMLFSKLSLLHRLLLRFPKAAAQKNKDQLDADNYFLSSFGKDKTYVDKKYLTEVISYIKA